MPLFDLFTARGEVPGFLLSARQDISAALAEIGSCPPSRIRADLLAVFAGEPAAPWVRELAAGCPRARAALLAALNAAYRTLVDARWREIESAVQSDLAQRGHVLLRMGLAEVLSTLPGTVRHRDQILEVDSPVERLLTVEGGLRFAPSLLMTHPVVLPAAPGDVPTVVYPAAPAPVRSSKTSQDVLSVVLGASRAEVLRASVQPRGTTELAQYAGVSLSSASEHATALRNAGLIMTARAGRKVRHTATALGMSLVAACEPVANRPVAASSGSVELVATLPDPMRRVAAGRAR
ncbi:winged helix-turn-helix domain-containing protein [Allokutzneria sp. NRRL B-24872]|uniref:winged helix-turn-helix domain-containing protein n=1 Tax=Allokutzneria sp. NRRL B-24872 TaxID=1137961 RepID=UPI000A3A1FC4|nr:winged helix-turn-helix domain-containing protein [Allokutzneria sp. NRRL B-24872]